MYELFGFKSIDLLKEKLQSPKKILIVGLSYCQKPLNCPKRFSSKCRECGCFVGKCKTKCREKKILFFPITSSYFLAWQLLKLYIKYTKREKLFLISACPFAINLFRNWASFLRLKGAAFSLLGSTCKSKKEFIWAEMGKKPTKTVLSKENESLFLSLLDCTITKD